MKQLAQGPMVSRWQSWVSNPGILTLEPGLYTCSDMTVSHGLGQTSWHLSFPFSETRIITAHLGVVLSGE